MLSALRKLKRSKPVEPRYAIPDGQRVYAVGDIHGRLDLFNGLLEAIEDDDAKRGAADTSLILLGDLVDRGPDSAGVIARARKLAESANVHILKGNHEEMFLDAFEDLDVLRHFMRYGGKETLLSYPVDKKVYRKASLPEVMDLMHAVVPEEDRIFISGLKDHVTIGDYLFVHAGIRPGVPLADQKPRELRWIREPFLSYADTHGTMVVHGHTICDEVEHRSNRIGIDTGAYASGRLTALGLEGTARWTIATSEGKDGCPQAVTRSLK